jgi:hypothetical protein
MDTGFVLVWTGISIPRYLDLVRLDQGSPQTTQSVDQEAVTELAHSSPGLKLKSTQVNFY